MGGYGGMGGMGGYGGGMGGMGGYGGMGGMGGGMYGQMGPQPGGFAEQAEMSSRPAFESIGQIVMAFQSVAMMLGSTYEALFSSFRAVIGVADQMTHMGSMFSAITMLRRLRGMLAWALSLVGIPPPAFLVPDPEDLEAAFSSGGDDEDENAPRTWPIMMFFAIALGGPYLIYRLLKASAGKTNDRRKPVKARAAHAYQAQSRDELSFQMDDMLTVYPPEQMNAYPQGWVMAALRGQRGLVPQNHLRLQRPPDQALPPQAQEHAAAAGIGGGNAAAATLSQAFESAGLQQAPAPASAPATAPPIDPTAWAGLPEAVPQSVVATSAAVANQHQHQHQRQHQSNAAPWHQPGRGGASGGVAAAPIVPASNHDWTASFAPPQQQQQQQPPPLPQQPRQSEQPRPLAPPQQQSSTTPNAALPPPTYPTPNNNSVVDG